VPAAEVTVNVDVEKVRLEEPAMHEVAVEQVKLPEITISLQQSDADTTVVPLDDAVTPTNDDFEIATSVPGTEKVPE